MTNDRGHVTHPDFVDPFNPWPTDPLSALPGGVGQVPRRLTGVRGPALAKDGHARILRHISVSRILRHVSVS